MKQLKGLLFWKKSAPLSLPGIKDKVIAEDAKITIGDSALTQLETYVQIDPESECVVDSFSVRTVSVRSKTSNKSKNSGKETELYRRLVREACLIPGSSLTGLPVEPLSLPFWINRKQLEDGRDFVRKHFFSVVFAHSVGLFLLLTIKVRKPALKTH
jgi:hypothetical protein